MKVKLNVMERIILSRFLPKEGNFLTLRLIREAENQLSFTQKELTDLQIKIENGNYTWSQEGNQKVGEKQIDLGDTLVETIVEKFLDLDKEKKLTRDLESLYVKFVKP